MRGFRFLEISILNKDLEIVTIIDIYESLIWTKRYCTHGDFELYIPANTEMLSYLKQDYYVTRDDDDTVMIIEKIEIQTDVENGDYYIITGRSLENILNRRIVWTQSNLSGNVVKELYRVLANNIGTAALPSRQISNFTFAEPLDIEDTIDMQVTGDDLESLVTEICKQYGLGYKVTINDDKNFVFSMYKGTLTEVYFSPEFDNLITSDYISDKTNYKNVAKVFGEGEGSARRSIAVGSASGLNRREMYVDARDISSNEGEISATMYNSMLTARGKEKLQETLFTKTFEGSVEPSMTFEYKRDYDLGDIVTVTNQYGVTTKPRIVEIIENWDDTGHKVVPTFEEWEV